MLHFVRYVGDKRACLVTAYLRNNVDFYSNDF